MIPLPQQGSYVSPYLFTFSNQPGRASNDILPCPGQARGDRLYQQVLLFSSSSDTFHLFIVLGEIA